MELSVVRAIAPSSGRSRSKRPTNSAEKCWASAADPPLPQASTLPPLVTQARMACTAAAIGLLKDWADWYLRSALSMKCCWMRCSSMVGDDNRPVSGRQVLSQGHQEQATHPIYTSAAHGNWTKH